MDTDQTPRSVASAYSFKGTNPVIQYSKFILISFFNMSGAVVEWLGRLDYGAESRRRVVSSRLGFAIRRLENAVNPALNGYLFSNKGRLRQR